MSLQMHEEDFGTCPSFNSYSTGTIADAATRAAGDFSAGSCPNSDHSFFDFDQSPSANGAAESNEDDFEFASLQNFGPVAPVFPIFDSNLLFQGAEIGDRDPAIMQPIRVPMEKVIIRDRDDDPPSPSSSVAEIDDRDPVIVQPIRIPLEKLVIRDRDDDPPSPSSSTSSAADELEGIPAGTYCVWKPRSVGTANLPCKIKSRSTGSSSSKRWGIRDLLRRSHSDGKNSYVSFTPSTKKSKEIKSETKPAKELKEKEKKTHSIGGDQKKKLSAHESLYVRNRRLKEEGKRKSYLPYKPDLVGFWTNVSGLGRATPL